MGKQRTVRGAYSSDGLGKDGTGPLKASRWTLVALKLSRWTTVKSFADIVDRNSAGAEESNHGLTLERKAQ